MTIDQTYAETLDNERKERNQRRKKYLELCGLFKLDPAGTLFGINAQQQVTTNAEEIKQHIGKFKWNGSFMNFPANLLNFNIGSFSLSKKFNLFL